MGSYPTRPFWPVTQHLDSFPCGINNSRFCGLLGQIPDLLRRPAGATADQVEAGIAIDECAPNGTSTLNRGWTHASLVKFLEVVDEHNITAVTIWTPDALLQPTKVSTCPWFFPTLRQWALGKRLSPAKSDDTSVDVPPMVVAGRHGS